MAPVVGEPVDLVEGRALHPARPAVDRVVELARQHGHQEVGRLLLGGELVGGGLHGGGRAGTGAGELAVERGGPLLCQRARLFALLQAVGERAGLGLGAPGVAERAACAFAGEPRHLAREPHRLGPHRRQLAALLGQLVLARREVGPGPLQLRPQRLGLALGLLLLLARRLHVLGRLLPRGLRQLLRLFQVLGLLRLAVRRVFEQLQARVDGVERGLAGLRVLLARAEQARPGDPREVLEEISAREQVDGVLQRLAEAISRQPAALEERGPQRLADGGLQRGADVLGGEVLVGQHAGHLLGRQRLDAVARRDDLQLVAERDQPLVGEAALEERAQPPGLQREQRQRGGRERRRRGRATPLQTCAGRRARGGLARRGRGRTVAGARGATVGLVEPSASRGSASSAGRGLRAHSAGTGLCARGGPRLLDSGASRLLLSLALAHAAAERR